MIQAEIRKSEPVHGHLVIFDTNLIIAMNHKLVSLPLANYLQGNDDEDHIIDVYEHNLTTIYEINDSQIVRIKYFSNYLEIIT